MFKKKLHDWTTTHGAMHRQRVHLTSRHGVFPPFGGSLSQCSFHSFERFILVHYIVLQNEAEYVIYYPH